MPTEDDFNKLLALKIGWDIDKKGYTFGSGTNTIFLPAVGTRNGATGSLQSQGEIGIYWSCTQNGTSDGAYTLYFRNDGYVTRGDTYSWYGFPIRCVKGAK
jgi:hypothetical protein